MKLFQFIAFAFQVCPDKKSNPLLICANSDFARMPNDEVVVGKRGAVFRDKRRESIKMIDFRCQDRLENCANISQH